MTFLMKTWAAIDLHRKKGTEILMRRSLITGQREVIRGGQQRERKRTRREKTTDDPARVPAFSA